jgi:hypothetical protein
MGRYGGYTTRLISKASRSRHLSAKGSLYQHAAAPSSELRQRPHGIMSLAIPLTPAEEANLLAKARAQGTTPEQVVRQAIEPIRIVAATGLGYGVPVISPDGKIRASRIQTIW